MAFKKAAPEQAALKISMFGPPGSGKSFTALLVAEGLAHYRGKRIAYVDTERGTDFYAMDTRKVSRPRRIHPEAFDFDAIYTRSLGLVLDEVLALDPRVHGVVVIDSITHLWTAAMEAYEGKKTARDSIPMHAWSAIKRPYKKLVDHLINSPMDVLLLGRQKNVFTEVEGELKMTGVGMRAEGETPYEPHICLRMENQQHPTDSTLSRVAMYVEKDRTGVLQGSIHYNPSFATIEPMLPLLGISQAKGEDEDERQARDAEAMDELAAEKARNREAKSSGFYADYAAKLTAATTADEIGTIQQGMKKIKRYLTEGHENGLRELLNAARDRVLPPAA